MEQSDIKRIALWLLIASVAVTTVIAIWAVALGDFDDTTGRILGTSLSLAGGSLLALAAATGWERMRLAAVAGVVGAVVGFGLLIIGIWSGPDGDLFWKFTVSAVIVGVTGAWVSLLGNARLAPDHAWVHFGAVASGVLLAVLVLVALWVEIDESGFSRVIGVVAVLVAAFSVVVPVMHRLDAAPAGAQRSVEWRFCPHCGAESDARPGHATVCDECGVEYRVDSGS